MSLGVSAAVGIIVWLIISSAVRLQQMLRAGIAALCALKTEV